MEARLQRDFIVRRHFLLLYPFLDRSLARRKQCARFSTIFDTAVTFLPHYTLRDGPVERLPCYVVRLGVGGLHRSLCLPVVTVYVSRQTQLESVNGFKMNSDR